MWLHLRPCRPPGAAGEHQQPGAARLVWRACHAAVRVPLSCRTIVPIQLRRRMGLVRARVGPVRPERPALTAGEGQDPGPEARPLWRQASREAGPWQAGPYGGRPHRGRPEALRSRQGLRGQDPSPWGGLTGVGLWGRPSAGPPRAACGTSTVVLQGPARGLPGACLSGSGACLGACLGPARMPAWCMPGPWTATPQ
jgi:hypothetical protein